VSLIDRIRPKKDSNGNWFYSILGAKTDSFSKYDSLKAFSEIPELNAVINWKASAFRNGKIQMVNKSGDVIDENPPLFANPNYFQAQGEFLRQTKLFHDIFGNEYMYILTGLSSGKLDSAKHIFTLPPQHVEIKENTALPFWIRTEGDSVYSIQWNGKKIPLDIKDLIHLNDNRVDVNPNNLVEGASKIQSLAAPLNNIRAAYEARGTNLTQMGPRGILSNGTKDGMGATMNLDKKAKDLLHQEMDEYGAMKGQKKMIMTNLALEWQAMGYSTENLKAFEEVTADHHKVCDAFGLSVDLFSRDKGSTFNNKEIAEKAAYQNTIIPEAQEWMDSINMFFGLTDNKLTMTFGHLPIFQADKDKTASALVKVTAALDKALASGVITIEEYKEQLDKFML